MDEAVALLFEKLTACYRTISDISAWHVLHAATDLDQINAIIDQRADLLREIREIDKALKAAGVPDNPLHQARYSEIKSIVQDVVDSDKNMMDRIAKRMNEIRDELKAKALFRTRALPGYIKQKYAFSK